MGLDRELLSDVYGARAVLESSAARMLAERRQADDLLDMASCVTTLDELTRSTSGPEDVAAWNATALRFHELLVHHADNHTIALLVDGLRDVIIKPLARTAQGEVDKAIDLTSEDFARAVRSFRKLLRLLADRDCDGAAAHWAQHVHTATQIMLDDGVGDATVRALLV
jgi:GntR family transcriptional repressor for pyruvate dehydrogenase complex